MLRPSSTDKRKRATDAIPKIQRGDVIIADVGEGASDVVVGKNIIKIGTLVVPALPVIVALIIFLLVGGGTAYYFSLPVKMPLNPKYPYFNVVVADFGEIDQSGKAIESAAGAGLSEFTFTTLKSTFKDLPQKVQDQFQLQVWHSSMYLKEMRYTIGRIATETEAQKLAQGIGANIVVYGTFKPTGDGTSFTPEFYVAPLQNEADEIIGKHNLGEAITETSLNLKTAMTERLELFSKFTLGVMYDGFGQNTRALDIFKDALTSSAAAQSSQGAQVINFFIGRENLFLAQAKIALAEDYALKATTAATPSEADAFRAKVAEANTQIEAYFASAETAYTASRRADDSYARAHIGLGGVALTRANLQSPLERFNDPQWIQRAVQEYSTANDLAARSNDAPTLLKAQLSLGNASFLQGESFLHQQDWKMAIAAFDRAIQFAEPQLPGLTEQYRMLGQTDLLLGNAYYEKGLAHAQVSEKEQSKAAYGKAVQIYSECVKLKKYPDKILQNVVVVTCEKYLTDVQKALASSP
ncbi:MAG: hypothetical protein HY327_13870 [Chloroflexi bacterium]|nr:hypothetical protein [Chloroflexota bacterium]